MVDPGMGERRGLGGGRHPGLGDHVQPPDLRRMLRHGFVMDREVVDEHRRGRLKLREQFGHRPPFAALVAEDAVVYLQPLQLGDAVGAILVADIGEDDDVGLGADRPERVERAVDQMLAVHLGVEKAVEQFPGALGRHRRPRAVGQRADEAGAAQPEMIAMRLGDIIGEVRREMQQHVVAVGDEQGPAHPSSACRAATRASGAMPSASAQATRSGS